MAKRQTRKTGRAARARKTTASKSVRAAATGRRAGARSATRSTRAKRTRPARATSRSRRVATSRSRQAGSRQTRRSAASAGNGPRRRSSRAARGRQMGRSTLHAKWIDSAADRAERPGQTLATRNHEVIQHWADERGAVPATIPTNDPTSPRVLRFNFPGYGGRSLQPVRWNDWLKTFDNRELVFLFQDRMKSGKQSNFFRLDNPNREDA